MEYMVIKWGMQFWGWCIYIWHGHKKLCVLVAVEVQCQANVQHWPEGPINIQHSHRLSLLDAPATTCPHEAKSGNSRHSRALPKEPFVLDEGEGVLVLSD